MAIKPLLKPTTKPITKAVATPKVEIKTPKITPDPVKAVSQQSKRTPQEESEIKAYQASLPKANVNYASVPKEPVYGQYKSEQDIYKDVIAGRITPEQQARELGAIARGENPNVSQSQLEQRQRESRYEWERQNPSLIDPFQKQINDMLDAGTAMYVPSATGGQYVDASGRPIGTLSGGRLTQGGTVQQGQQLQQTQPNAMQNYLEMIKQQQIKEGVASLEKARQAGLSSLAAERPQIQQATLGTLGQVQKAGAASEQQLKEYLAQRFGAGSQSGMEAQSELERNLAMQQGVGQANLLEQQALADVARREQGIQQAYAQDVAGVEAGAQAQYLQGAMQEQQRQAEIQRQQQALQQQQLREDFLRQQGIAREDQLRAQALQQQQQEQARQEQIATIGQYSRQPGGYAGEIKRRKETPDTSDDALIPYLEMARDQKLTGQEAAAESYKQQQQQLAREFEAMQYDRAMKMWKATGVVTPEISSILRLPAGTPTSDNAYRQAQLALQQYQAQTSRMRAQSRESKPKPVDIKAQKKEIDKATSGQLAGTPSQKQAELITGMYESGKISQAQAQELIKQYGLSEKDLMLADAALQIYKQTRGSADFIKSTAAPSGTYPVNR